MSSKEPLEKKLAPRVDDVTEGSDWLANFNVLRLSNFAF